ncbi:hypothetical protein TIFTF001_012466 [Ficus carica]|uniref:Uncharacterized protein n=1 Tax=Ficus carica TaxID=3494 RepID=A0AA87ZW03_FICCA|nr:hypothetical protein TIFTF001_051338 [Ficus carica]GMN24003.1 hypothetical protein TIFTF001_051339 [Ficus carica]GMN43263.1 hypothetical protein TIFTF001_012466 [Ficus carica]
MMRCPPPLGVAGHEELWSPSACSTSNCLLHLAYVTLVTSSPKISLPFKASMTGHLLRVSQKWLAYQATWLITSPCLCHQAKSLLSKPPRRTGHAMVVNKIWACSRTCVEVKMMMCPKVDLPHLACVAKLKACFIVTKLTRFVINHWPNIGLVGGLVRNINKFLFCPFLPKGLILLKPTIFESRS